MFLIYSFRLLFCAHSSWLGLLLRLPLTSIPVSDVDDDYYYYHYVDDKRLDYLLSAQRAAQKRKRINIDEFRQWRVAQRRSVDESETRNRSRRSLIGRRCR